MTESSVFTNRSLVNIKYVQLHLVGQSAKSSFPALVISFSVAFVDLLTCVYNRTQNLHKAGASSMNEDQPSPSKNQKLSVKKSIYILHFLLHLKIINLSHRTRSFWWMKYQNQKQMCKYWKITCFKHMRGVVNVHHWLLSWKNIHF